MGLIVALAKCIAQMLYSTRKSCKPPRANCIRSATRSCFCALHEFECHLLSTEEKQYIDALRTSIIIKGDEDFSESPLK